MARTRWNTFLRIAGISVAGVVVVAQLVPYGRDHRIRRSTSWLLQDHVQKGRQALNFSEWQKSFEEANEAGQTVRLATMPPASYILTHSEARLSTVERQQLARGLDASIRGTQPTAAD